MQDDKTEVDARIDELNRYVREAFKQGHHEVTIYDDPDKESRRVLLSVDGAADHAIAGLSIDVICAHPRVACSDDAPAPGRWVWVWRDGGPHLIRT